MPVRRSVVLVVNPQASGVTAKGRVLIQNAFAAEHDLEVVETHRRSHATRIAQGAAARRIDVVVSLGGDGTLNEVANGVAGTGTAMAALPGGSTNVFARSLGYTNDAVAAAEEVLTALRADSIRRVGLGNVNGRYFCFHVGMGYDAAVVERVESKGSMKRWLGHALFGWAALDTWLRTYDRTSPAFRVTVAGTPRGPSALDVASVRRPREAAAVLRGAGRALRARWRAGEADVPVASIDGFFAIALNCDPYTYLGPRALSLVPSATLDDPLALVTLRTLDLGTTLRAVGAALRGHGVEGVAGVDVRTGLHGFTVTGHRPFPWQMDGDHLGDTELLEFRWEPDAIDLVVPVPAAPAPAGPEGQAKGPSSIAPAGPSDTV
jgi:diacylglycerol kinase family enzyme